MSQSTVAAPSVFAVAESIVEELKKLADKQQQVQAIRYASDSLGLGTSLHSPPSVEPSTSPGLAMSPQSTVAQTHAPDIKTFTEAKAPKSDVQFATVVAYFYRFEVAEQDQKDAIDAKTLKEAARLAGRRRPPRPSATLTNAKNAGYLDSAGSGRFKINAVGENLVAVTLPGGSSEAAAGTRGPRARRNKKAAKKNKSGSNKRTKRGR